MTLNAQNAANRDAPSLVAQLATPGPHHRHPSGTAWLSMTLLTDGMPLIVVGALLAIWPVLITGLITAMIFPTPMTLQQPHLRSR